MKENIWQEVSINPRQELGHVLRRIFSRLEACTKVEGWLFNNVL
jgi:hypothetical protein